MMISDRCVMRALNAFISFLGVAIVFSQVQFSHAQFPQAQANDKLTDAASEIPWDYRIQAGYRNFPLGAGIAGEIGLNSLLWGVKPNAAAVSDSVGNPTNGIMYGFVRAAGRIQTSGLTNSVVSRVQVFPISFAGLTVGWKQTHRGADFHGVDCLTLDCRGWVGRPYVDASVILGYGIWFLSASTQYEWHRHSGSRAFYDESSALIGGPHPNRLDSWEFTTGLKCRNDDLCGVMWTRQDMATSSSHNESWSLFYQHRPSEDKLREKWSYSVGAGQYSSDWQRAGFSFFLSIKWIGRKSLEL